MDFDNKLGGLIGLVLGLLFIVGGAWVRNSDAGERAKTIETTGTVMDSVSRFEQGKDMYAPVIEFEANGDRRRFTGNYESYRTSNGNSVVVRYDPRQPADSARVVDPLEGLTPWAMFGIGGLTTLTSAAALLGIKWPSRKATPT